MPTLDFKGKQFIYSHHHSVPFRELVIEDEKSLPAKNKKPGQEKPKLDDNLIINGDNLHALKALMPLYAGKVKCIYIDPPYNTGNEGWCYNDNVNSPLMKEWLAKNANPVDREDLQRHDKWLCMMYPRLKLLHELLADDGVIFVSIDDNEVHHLRAVMDEIWGDYNFISQITVQLNPRGRTLDKYLAKTHEFILLYAKNTDSGGLYEVEKGDVGISDYKYEDDNGKYRLLELRNRNPVFDRSNRSNLYYPFYINEKNNSVSLTKSDENKIEVYPINSNKVDGCWTWGKDKAKNNQNLLVSKLASTGAWRIFRKDYLYKNGNIATTKEKAIWLDKLINNQNGKEVLGEIFNKCPFDFPKSQELIKKCLRISTISDKSSIILDSFAGSGTTAHAVLDLNKEDGGNRKFILVQIDEKIKEDTEAYKAGFKSVIDITAERVRRVIQGVPNSKDEKLKNGLGGSFTFCKLGDEFSIEKILTGEALPKYESLANYVFYTATGKSLEMPAKQRLDYFVGETDLYEVYLIYQADIAFLRSNESALNSKIVEIISGRESKKQKLVFASAKYMGQNELNDYNIIFCQLPYAIHKITTK
jgi:adenine-specific DNA-methyltransferase